MATHLTRIVGPRARERFAARRHARALLATSIVLVLLTAGQVAFQLTQPSTVHMIEADNGRVVFVPLGDNVDVSFPDAENLGERDALYIVGVLKCPTVESDSMTCSVGVPGPAVTPGGTNGAPEGFERRLLFHPEVRSPPSRRSGNGWPRSLRLSPYQACDNRVRARGCRALARRLRSSGVPKAIDVTRQIAGDKDVVVGPRALRRSACGSGFSTRFTSILRRWYWGAASGSSII